MSLVKKAFALALIMAVLVVPAVALSENADGLMITNDTRVTKNFDDRTAGIITVNLKNDSTADITVDVYIIDQLKKDVVYASVKGVSIPAGGYVNVELKFTVTVPGEYWGRVMVMNADVPLGQVDPMAQMGVHFNVDRSIWSNTWTYVAIIFVIVIVGIALFIRMRSNPKAPEEAGTFTAMEEKRKEERKRTGTGKKEYKGRSKKE
jgi:hypothetical protein